jgi:serine phosphatase RsbU (regulator of sigma subunit)
LGGTFTGRALVLGTLLKLLALLLQLGGASAAAGVIDTAGTISLIAGAAALAFRLFTEAKRSLLWRVRRKLTLSYIFIGFVPALLIIAFFLIAGLLLFFNVSSYMMQSRVSALVDQVQFLARAAALDLQRDPADLAAILNRRQIAAAADYPDVSLAVVPADAPCASERFSLGGRADPAPVTAGPWDHLEPPQTIPAWVPCEGYAGLIVFVEAPREQERAAGAAGEARLAVRAVAWPDDPRSYAVVVDAPFGAAIAHRIQQDTGIEMGNVTALSMVNGDGRPPTVAIRSDAGAGRSTNESAEGRLDPRFEWVAFLDYTDWQTGSHDSVAVAFRMGLRDIFNRISGAPLTPVRNLSFGQALLILLAVVGSLFLVIQVVALTMGLALARSITGSVHELFAGTERLRGGDFSHKIAVRSRDQLGELADSFNSMTASIEDLLQQKAEKERLEQELRIARSIQMSLLPQNSLTLPGVAIAGHCEPAREVGGDYYDLLPLDEHRLGLLIADVAGKGTSAALYMAELKGIVLSLSQFHSSPRRLLIDADRILARHLDARSFITATYAVIDLRAHTLTYARAGHCPLIYVPGPYAPSRTAEVLAPDGMVLGLQLDNGEMFSRLLEEARLPLGYGDLVLLYTDGLTEAMNAEGEYFGDARLAQFVQQHADLPSDELRERILREVRAFSGSGVQQDDMTLVLFRMEGVGAAQLPQHAVGAAAPA